MPERLTTLKFIERAKDIHNNMYDYSKVVYVNMHTPITIVCKKHGDFTMRPYSHVNGQGCPQCGIELRVAERTMTREEFIRRARLIHSNKYDYSKVIYINSHTKVCIVCPIHGEFWQKPIEHLSGKGCWSCGGTKGLTTEQFIAKAKLVHGDRYIYDKVIYKSNKEKVCITCREHGDFWVIPNNHLKGTGCGICADIHNSRHKIKKAKETFIEECEKIHKNKYDYSRTIYKSADDYIDIICPKHGLFKQKASSHKQGHGCPHCKRSKGEEKIANYLNDNKVEYIQQYIINNNYLFCTRNTMKVDFFLPKENVFIEFNGKQHYESIEYFGGEERLKEQVERDIALRSYCKEHDIRLVEIPYTNFEDIETILKKVILC